MKALRFHSTFHRAAGAALAAGVVIFAAMSVVWTIANTSATAAREKEVADLLTKLSPGDPQTHLASAKLHEKAFESADIEIGLSEYEMAAGRAPNNYVNWLLLGSARARAGDNVGAEAAFRRASELAPFYSRVRWALGNLLLREGRDGEAYQQIRSAVEADPNLSSQAASIALTLADGDVETVRKNLQGLPEAEVRLASLLTEQKRYREAIDVWRGISLPPASPRFEEARKLLVNKAFDAKEFRLAAEIAEAPRDASQPNPTVLTNGDFEAPVKSQNAGFFDWRVPTGTNPQFAVTGSQKMAGQFSLLAILNSTEPNGFQGISQIAAVEPGKDYTFEFAYRADVKGKAEFKWELVSANDRKLIASSDALQLSTDWTNVQIKFAIPSATDGVELRLVRAECSGNACSSAGSFWFDEFKLYRNN